MNSRNPKPVYALPFRMTEEMIEDHFVIKGKRMETTRLTATAKKDYISGDWLILIPNGVKYKNEKITEVIITEEFIEDFATIYPVTVENNTMTFDIKT